MHNDLCPHTFQQKIAIKSDTTIVQLLIFHTRCENLQVRLSDTTVPGI